MPTTQITSVSSLTPGIVGWLWWFVVRFYVGALIALAAALGDHHKVYFAVGIVELSIGVLLSRKNRKGVTMARVWLIIESIAFGLLGTLALLPPRQDEIATRFIGYSIGAAIITVYFFVSQRVQLTYPKLS